MFQTVCQRTAMHRNCVTLFLLIQYAYISASCFFMHANKVIFGITHCVLFVLCDRLIVIIHENAVWEL